MSDEGVSLEDLDLPSYPKLRTDLKCGECQAQMVLRESKFGVFYGCTRFPECKGSHGAHADGRPKGKPGDEATKKARIRAHQIFDQVWKKKLVKNRGAAYQWMQKAMKISRSEAHIGEFSIDQCNELMRQVYHHFPSLRDRWATLLVDPLDDD